MDSVIAMTDPHDPDAIPSGRNRSFARGFVTALPLALLLWGLVAWLA